MDAINTTVTFNNGKTPWFHSVQLTAETLHGLSRKPETLQRVLATLQQLTPDDYSNYLTAYYANGLEKFADVWGYCDLLTALHAAAKVLAPKNYLEIGVRRGRSLGIVADCFPSVNLYGFDLWIQDYAGMENPGPEFVASEMKKLGHFGALTLISGNSRETIPQFFRDNENLYFDLITVDGDHSEEGARIDLNNVIPRLKKGGVLLLDDITHPQHRYLEVLWDELITNNESFSSKKYGELGYGIAFAVRRDF